MSETMRKLKRDHANLARLMAGLERQVAAMERGDRPDWDIIQRIVEYCLTYPDLHHHPLEDQVLVRFRLRDPAAAAPFVGLDDEHRQLGTALRQFAAAVERVFQDATVPREWFVTLARKFVGAQREHIRREDLQFFPAAERCLLADDWSHLDASESTRARDPLFERPTEREFQALMRDIEWWEAGRETEVKPGEPRLDRPRKG